MTNNGFTKTPNLFQVLAYTLSLADIVLFSILAARFTLLPLVLAYFLVLLALLISWLHCTCFDPSDPSIKLPISQVNNKGGKYLYCDDCDSFVDMASKHCRTCNRCVRDFDHHCKWLNNCINKQNYLSFIGCVVLTSVKIMLFVGMNGVTLDAVLYRQEPIRADLVVGWSLSLVQAIMLFFLIQLLLFHIYLKIRRQTTYQYIIKKEKENSSVEITLQNDRINN